MALNANPMLVNHMRVMRRDLHAKRGILLTMLLKCCLEVAQSYNSKALMRPPQYSEATKQYSNSLNLGKRWSSTLTKYVFC